MVQKKEVSGTVKTAETPATKTAATTKTVATKTTTKTAATTKTAKAKTPATQAATKTNATKTNAAKTASKVRTTKPAASKPAAAKSATAKDVTAKPAASKPAAAKDANVKTVATKAKTLKDTAKKTTAVKATTAKVSAKAAATKTSVEKAFKGKVEAKPAAAKTATKTATKTTATKPAAAKVSASAKLESKTPTKTSVKAESAKTTQGASIVEPAVTKGDKLIESKPTKAAAPKAEKTPEDAKLALESEAIKSSDELADISGVLIAAAECTPFVKVGGLADIVGALPKYLKKLGIDARVIMPLHRQIKERYGAQLQHMCNFQASLGWRSQYVGLEKLELDGLVYYFIDNEFYFGGPIYCGGEFEGEQYAFFTRAVMDAIPQLDFDVRVLHCNDWHTAMMPLLAKTQYHGGMQEGLRTLLTIHNLHFQGQFSHEFDRDLLRVDDSLATPQFIEHYGCDNMLKAGIVFADKVNTVSPTYAREICEPYLGESLDGVLRSRGGDLWGILNGIDTEVWSPQTDSNLTVNFSASSIARKQEVRDSLLEELGLEPAGANTAVISMVGRLTPQKGIELVNATIDELMNEDVRVIVLGSGYREFEDFLRGAEGRHKGRLCSYIGYNAELSHRIYAGSDLFLMPSLFEPCGISQMISMRYGTLPIVRETGGLKDTVIPYNEFTGEGNGFSFANYNAREMLDVIRYALWVWRDEGARKSLMTQAMESDFSFDRCARTYAELYRVL